VKKQGEAYFFTPTRGEDTTLLCFVGNVVLLPCKGVNFKKGKSSLTRIEELYVSSYDRDDQTSSNL
jgi:hypothetical protein